MNIQPARGTDSITVIPAGGTPWNPGLPISLRAGTSTALTATSASGATVVLERDRALRDQPDHADRPGGRPVHGYSHLPGHRAVAGTTATYTIR